MYDSVYLVIQVIIKNLKFYRFAFGKGIIEDVGKYNATNTEDLDFQNNYDTYYLRKFRRNKITISDSDNA